MLLGGSWDLVSKVISTLIGVISIVTLIITIVTKSHDPLSMDCKRANCESGCADSDSVLLAFLEVTPKGSMYLYSRYLSLKGVSI